MGTLSIVATPIGNLEDISLRAIKTLFSVDAIACEDTRRTGQLLHSLKERFQDYIQPLETIREPVLFRYDNHTEQTATPELLSKIENGSSIALVSDAGTPLLSDPGYVLVREARRKHMPVVIVPGASAALAALVGSGLPADKFMFLGYPPEKQGHRIKLFTSLLEIHALINNTFVLYSAPHKLASLLTDMATALGDIRIVVSRELTKVHEEYWNGTVSEALSYFNDPKGEFVVLFHL